MKLDEKIDNNSKEIDNLRNKIESLFCQTEKHEEKFSITIQDHLILRDVVTNNRSSLMSKIDEIEDDFTKKINDLKLFNKMISERTKENSEQISLLKTKTQQHDQSISQDQNKLDKLKIEINDLSLRKLEKKVFEDR